MTMGGRSGRARRDRGTWLMLAGLMLGVLVPAASVVWFMTEAANNQADAARQRLSDALQGQLRLLRDRVDSNWRTRLAELGGGTADAAGFQRAVLSGGLDSIVLLDRNGGAAYPTSVASPQSAAVDEGVDWRMAAALELSGEYHEAAQAYAAIVARERTPDRAARAAQAHVRALIQSRDTVGAVRAIERYASTPRVAAGRDRHRRLVIADAQLMALQLMTPADARFRASATSLAALVNDYAVTMPASQRLFVMSQLRTLAGAATALPTYAAERLAAEFMEADGSVPANDALEASRLRGVWKLAIGHTAIALFRTETITALADTVLDTQNGASGTMFALVPPGTDAGTESIAAGGLLPGWLIRVSLAEGGRTDQAATGRMTTYLWAGTLTVAGLAMAGLLLWQAFRRQMRVSRLKTDLVAAVSHELRTPLASMRALVDLLLESATIDRGQTRDYLRLIAGENARLSRLIEHFLTFARVERNSQSLVLRDVSPDTLVREATAVQGIERFPGLSVEVAPALPLLYGDEDALVTVLMNLLENAYKYSGDDRRVALRVRAENARVTIEVEDNGIGIASRDQKRIFRPFYQVDQRLARERGGCGLGLSIVDFIVRAHGGRVTVESTPGSGSVFKVVLPSRATAREVAA